jgi:hypothetical protein
MKIVTLGACVLCLGLSSSVAGNLSDHGHTTATIQRPQQVAAEFLMAVEWWTIDGEPPAPVDKRVHVWRFWPVNGLTATLYYDQGQLEAVIHYTAHLEITKTGAGPTRLDLEYKNDAGERWVRPGIITIEKDRLIWVTGADVAYQKWVAARGKVAGRPTNWAAPSKGTAGGRMFLKPQKP